MSGGFALLGAYANASTYTMAPSPGSANAKGSWVQIVASLPHDVGAVVVEIPGFYTGIGNIAALDIGIGASGVEVPIINNLISAIDSIGNVSGGQVLVPIAIPAGTRVAVRVQTHSGTGSTSGGASITFFDTDFSAPDVAAIVDSIGFVSGSTEGTAVTPGVGSVGSYAQLIASTSFDYLGFFAIFDPQSGFNVQAFTLAIDISVGSSGSEVVLVPAVASSIRPSSGFNLQSVTSVFLIPIPAGSRIAARAKVDTSSGGAIGVTLYGLRK